MKVISVFAFSLVSILLIWSTSSSAPGVSTLEGKKPPEVFILGAESKLGQIKFNHLDHITKNRNLEGTAPMACIECHHTAQPASEVAKHPPLKTSWPSDRTTTLTADLLEKGSPGSEVVICRDCHSRTDTKPKLLPELPQIKLEEGTALVTLNNQQAFHRNCGGCHDEIVKNRKDVNPPTSKKCVVCHKKTAA